MSRRYNILAIYVGSALLLRGKSRYLDDYGVSVQFDEQRYYLEVFS